MAVEPPFRVAYMAVPRANGCAMKFETESRSAKCDRFIHNCCTSVVAVPTLTTGLGGGGVSQPVTMPGFSRKMDTTYVALPAGCVNLINENLDTTTASERTRFVHRG